MSKRAKRSIGLGLMTIVVTLLLASAVVRLASGTGAAIARELQSPEPRSLPAEHSVSTVEEAALRHMYDDLVARDAELADQEAVLEKRLVALAEAEAAISLQLAELESAENALRDTLALAKGASETDLTQLTSVYENMKPKEAAELFEEMAPQFAAGFIGRMRPEAAAGILAGLSPQAAYSISAVMAGRHMDVPTE